MDNRDIAQEEATGLGDKRMLLILSMYIALVPTGFKQVTALLYYALCKHVVSDSACPKELTV